jgi:hypothetical protein
MRKFELQPKRRTAPLLWGIGILLSLGLSLAIFSVLGLWQKTGEKGEKLVRSLRFSLPPAPQEAAKPPPPPAQEEVKPPVRPKRKAKPKSVKSKTVRRRARPLRRMQTGIPRRILQSFGETGTPAFVMADTMDILSDRSTTEAYSNASTLIQREAAEMASRLERGRNPSGRTQRAGIRPARCIRVDFPDDAYPRAMIDAGIECLAVTQAVVSKEGFVEEVRVLDLKPHPRRSDSEGDLEKWMDVVQKTLQKISRNWRFRAAVDRSKNLPVEDVVIVNILFEIET